MVLVEKHILESMLLLFIRGSIVCVCVGGGGGQGVRPDHLENHKAIGFLINTGPYHIVHNHMAT